MKFTYSLTRITAQGQREIKSREFQQSVITIGRGGKSDLLIDGDLVATEHARFELKEQALWVVDLNSASGLRVNDRGISTAELKSGDVLTIGDHALTIDGSGDAWTASEERRDAESLSFEQRIENAAHDLNLETRLPPLASISALVILIVIGAFLVLPLQFGIKTESWSSGPLANPHRLVSNKCESCHTKPFEPVQDKTCRACHNLSDHSESYPNLVKHNSELEIRCASCHMDHNGDHGIIARESELCADCHNRIKELAPKSEYASFSSFDAHPKFRIPDSDPTTIKLNHQVHLKPGLKGVDGEVTVQCSDCHRLASNFRTIEPIKFERDCRSCHSLEFDPRLPENQVPHGEPDVVYNYMYAEYAKLFLRGEAEPTETGDFNLRQKPGYQAQQAPEKLVEFSRSNIESESRAAEQQLFTKTACQLCHKIDEKSSASTTQSKYEVVKPEIPERWLEKSTFSHGSHEEVKCESCHSGVRDSDETSDILLPKIEDCQACHSETGMPRINKAQEHPTVRSDCVLCHSFHDSLPMNSDIKRDIEDVISEY